MKWQINVTACFGEIHTQNAQKNTPVLYLKHWHGIDMFSFKEFWMFPSFYIEMKIIINIPYSTQVGSWKNQHFVPEGFSYIWDKKISTVTFTGSSSLWKRLWNIIYATSSLLFPLPIHVFNIASYLSCLFQTSTVCHESRNVFLF